MSNFGLLNSKVNLVRHVNQGKEPGIWKCGHKLEMVVLFANLIWLRPVHCLTLDQVILPGCLLGMGSAKPGRLVGSLIGNISYLCLACSGKAGA